MLSHFYHQSYQRFKLTEMYPWILLLLVNTTYGLSTSSKLSQYSWFNNDLQNPCNAKLAQRSPNSAKLSLNRPKTLRFFALNLRSRLRRMESELELRNCPYMELQSLPEFDIFNGSSSNNINLEELYKRFLLLSAHFRYMSYDWRHGNKCEATKHAKSKFVSNKFTR